MEQNISTISEDYMNNAWKTHHPVDVIKQYSHTVFESTKNNRTRIMYDTKKFHTDTTELIMVCGYVDEERNYLTTHTITIEGNRDELNQFRWYLNNDPRLSIVDCYMCPEF